MTTPLALFDLFAILPFYVFLIDDMIVSYNLPVEVKLIRAIRFLWVFRIFKLGRYNNSLHAFKEVLKNKKEDLIISYTVLFLILYLSSALMYYIENSAQPDLFSSIPHAMWWGVATLTTIGYGDIIPITFTGKLISGIIAIIGIGFVGLPTGILASGFIEQYQKQKKIKRRICPHCHHEIPE
jgi:voltage-gated potassium channel